MVSKFKTMAAKYLADRYETIIWDWNGTILNDLWLCVEIANYILENHGNRHLSSEEYREVFGFPIQDYYKKIGIDFTKESFEALNVKFISKYEAKVKECQLQEHVQDVLALLQSKQKQQFILTAAKTESVFPQLDHFDIRNYFLQVAGLDNHRAESKVERGLNLLKNQKIRPGKSVLIGDTIHDYEVAQHMGVDCMLIAQGHQSKRRLEHSTSGKVRVLDSILDLS